MSNQIPVKREYGKDVTAEYATGLSFDEAMVMARSGFLVRREVWNKNCYVFWAALGKCEAVDHISAVLEPFPVFHSVTGVNIPWIPREHDLAEKDYTAYTRQVYEARVAIPMAVRVQDQD
jgi:hypothetical protein